MTKKILVCVECGSAEVYADARVNLNNSDEVNLYDDNECNTCGTVSVNEVEVPDDFDIYSDKYRET